jgi:hypothetical protein
MKSKILWGLIGLNVLLLVCAVGRFMPSNAAHAQAHRPGDYLMIPGVVTGNSSEVVYIVDTTNGILGGMFYDDGNKDLVAIPTVDLNQVFNAGGGPGPAPVRRNNMNRGKGGQ